MAKRITCPISRRDGTAWESATVADLIATLQQFPADALVVTEGCDCWGEAFAVQEEENGLVLIARAE